jgi:hypothetical protein
MLGEILGKFLVEMLGEILGKGRDTREDARLEFF